MANKPTFEQLGQLRATPQYPRGEIIDSAADLALEVGPTPKSRSRYRNPIARRAVSASARVDYAAIDAKYAELLTNTGATGWTDAENTAVENEQIA